MYTKLLGIVCFLFVSVALMACANATPTPAPTPTPVPPSAIKTIGRTKGNPDAKVTLVVYADFQCPYSRRYWRDIEPQIEEAYVNTGKISYTYKYFPVIDGDRIGESHWAAYAAECANEQGKFWEYHDKLYQEAYGENSGVFTRDYLKKYAAEIKLDTAKFNACLDSDRYAPLVLEHLIEALQRKLPGTPTFLMNGRRIDTSTLDYAEFWKPLDAELKIR
jgi:protein-disulfide isomerase